ncbi:MAG: hypothetical protein OEX21_09775 [Betaproteobacteria bacterium]|nr:hypothetical protein [Betaproteobacteria bacterium]
MNRLIVATIAVGLLVDRHGGVPGQLAVSVVAWAVLARLWLVSAPAQRPALLACLVYATAGEVFLSLVWGLYDYRLGNIPLFVPPGHVLLFTLGTRLADRLEDGAEWWIAALALPLVAGFAWSGRDTLGPLLYALFIACMALSASRKLYATMLVASLAMELWGTWLGNWTWRREVPWLGLVTDNPPLAAGAFYATLDLLVVSTVAAWRRQPPASPILTPSAASHQAATCSVRSSSR